ncbi:MAG: N-6 DNA methylase, partial [Gemmatimonadota bacterium]
MLLDRILAAIATVHDFPRLVAALGQEPLWEELPADFLVPRQRGSLSAVPSSAALVGRAGEFRWYGTESSDPAALARRAVHRLGERGQIAGVIVLDRSARRLAIAVAFGRPAVLEVNLDAPDPIALRRLTRAAGIPPGGALALAARTAEAISGEGVGHRFFLTFRATLERMAAGLDGRLTGEDRHAISLLQLTRVLFLYFIQSKGWLDGREDFLRGRIDDCLSGGRRIHRDLLRPLFFGTLNRPVAKRGRSAGFGRIPFLNGGLFEPHPLERRWRGDIPNALWRDAFDGLFERFHFTISEAGAPGSIAPDMLGRVFEGVMAPEERRGSGTFYTPASLVRSLIDSALAGLISNRLACSEPEAAARLAEGDALVDSVLADVTLLDPAVGSGAFLLGALERLAELRARHGLADKRDILRRNLFGVDRNATAVRLTELRLWLATIADDPSDHPESVRPLPNLDCLIRQGDSLIDPIGLIGRLPIRAHAAGALLAEVRQRFVIASGEQKADAARRLRQAERQAWNECLDSAEERVRLELAECLGAARAPTLFGERRGLDATLRARLRVLRQRMAFLRRARRQLARDGVIPWFQYESQFADVFARGGFDVVVGNPPWVRAEQIPALVRERLAARYRWWKGEGTGFRHRPDLAVAFVERGFELLGPGGVLAFLVPSKLATAAYGVKLRRALSGEGTLFVVADLPPAEAARFDATVYPLALVVGRQPAAARHVVRSSLLRSGAPVPQTTLMGGAPWIMARSAVRDALDRLRGEHPRLDERFTIQLGVKTGANAVFLAPRTIIEPVLLRWAIRGRDVRAFSVERRLSIIWTHDDRGRVRPRLPPLATAHFAAHDTELRARSDYGSGPPWTLFRTL